MSSSTRERVSVNVFIAISSMDLAFLLGLLVRKKNSLASDRRMSVKLMPTFADGGFSVVIATDPYYSILGFLDRRHYYEYLFQVAPQLYSRG
jgi:hypothetical protein